MLDRDLQRRILEALRSTYPAPAHGSNSLAKLTAPASHAEDGAFAFNLAYLHEHGLIDAEMRMSNDGGYRIHFNQITITAKGLDFLEDDGGLSAILGVVTVRLHADTMRELLMSRVDEESALSAEEKAGLHAAIRKLPEAALTEATKFLVRVGLQRLPDAVYWLQTLAHP